MPNQSVNGCSALTPNPYFVVVCRGCAVISGLHTAPAAHRVAPSRKSATANAVDAHVGVIGVAEDAKYGLAVRQEKMTQLEFNILRAGAAQVGVEVNAVRHLGHQRFRESHGPMPVVVFHHCGVGKTARIRGIVVGAVIVERPVHELEIAVRAVRVHVEKIHQAEFSEAKFQAPHRQFLEQ